MRIFLLIWSLVLGHCLAGPGFFMNQQGVVAVGIVPPEPVSDFNPTNYGTVLAWYSARLESFANGDAVSTITDWSGNGRDATQATSAKRPVFVTNVVNGLPVFRFDGIDDSAQTGLFAWGTSVSFIIIYRDAGAAFTAARILEIGDANHARLVTRISTSFIPTALWGTSSSQVHGSSISGGDFFTHRFYGQSSGSFQYWINGTSQGTGSAVAPSTTDRYLTLSDYGVGGVPGNGDIAEVVVFSGAMTDAVGCEAALLDIYANY